MKKWVWGNFLKLKNRGKAVYGKFYQMLNLGEITFGETSKNLKIQGKPVGGNVRGDAHFPQKQLVTSTVLE